MPALTGKIRVVDTLGPSPMPPWVIHKSVSAELREAVGAVLLEMHTDTGGSAILGEWGISHFCPASDALYDPIRKMTGEARGVRLG